MAHIEQIIVSWVNDNNEIEETTFECDYQFKSEDNARLILEAPHVRPLVFHIGGKNA